MGEKTWLVEGIRDDTHALSVWGPFTKPQAKAFAKWLEIQLVGGTSASYGNRKDAFRTWNTMLRKLRKTPAQLREVDGCPDCALAGEVDGGELSFEKLREVNVRRCEQVFHDIDDWSPTDWACAMAGETGEACNFAKKMRRGENTTRDKDTGQEIPIVLAIGYELADAVIYADLLAARLGLDLGEMVQQKFNVVSERRGCTIRLAALTGEEPEHAESEHDQEHIAGGVK